MSEREEVILRAATRLSVAPTDMRLALELGGHAAKQAMETIMMVADRHPVPVLRPYILTFALQALTETKRLMDADTKPKPSLLARIFRRKK
jgi:hypothetical protein